MVILIHAMNLDCISNDRCNKVAHDLRSSRFYAASRCESASHTNMPCMQRARLFLRSNKFGSTVHNAAAYYLGSAL